MNTPFGDRDWKITVAGASIPRDLGVSFTVRKTLEPEPNTCEVTLLNLSESSRSNIEGLRLNLKMNAKGTRKGTFKKVGPQTGNIRVDVEAGYTEAGRSLIFSGSLRTAVTESDGIDSRTVIWGEDSGQAFWAARVSASFPPGTTYETVARYCAARSGLGEGNLPAVFSGGIPGVGAPNKVFPRGTTLSGSAMDELRGVLRGMGVSMSIQDGVVFCVLSDRRKISPTTFVVLSPSSGMLGSPARTPEGRVRVRSLIRPGLFPGGGVELKSSLVTGQYTIVSVDYSGDTYGGAWFADLEVV